MPVLGHRWEEVVLDLVVEVGHPPVDEAEGAGRHVHRVHGRVAHPVHLCVLLGHRGEVCVRHGEVDEDVVGSEPGVGQVHGQGLPAAEARGDEEVPQHVPADWDFGRNPRDFEFS